MDSALYVLQCSTYTNKSHSYVVEMSSWKANKPHPRGTIITQLTDGDAPDLDILTRVILIEHGVSFDQTFPDDVEYELEYFDDWEVG